MSTPVIRLCQRMPLLPYTATDLTVCLGIPPEVAGEAARNFSPDVLREFAKMLIFGVSRDSIPMGLQEYDYDQAEYAEAMLRERSLLYVAATRARDEVISYSGERSELLFCVTAD